MGVGVNRIGMQQWMKIELRVLPGTWAAGPKKPWAGPQGTPVPSAEGAVNQLKGTAQDLYGQARDGAADIAAAARDAGSPFERVLRRTIARQPYAAVALALGIGWLLGRSRRPI